MAQKLLLIDENDQLLNLVGDYLSNLGCEVHRARHFDEVEALLKNYHYAVIITGTGLANFGAPDHNLARSIQDLVPRPRIVFLEEAASHSRIAPLQGDGLMLVIEKPVSLLRLGNLMCDIALA